MSAGRLIIINVDGLGANDLPRLFSLMPKTAKHLAQLNYKNVNCAPFVSAQPIWAELLTGRPWFENGCAGFSKPRGSLRKLEVFTEDDLLAPVTLLSKVKDVVINIPLLKSCDSERVFLSDGSTSSSKLVSPSSLLHDEVFQKYRPRPYASAVSAMSHRVEALLKCVETERARMRCAMALFSRPQEWERFLLRLSIFDHLAHLFGPDVCAQPTLQGFSQLQSFISELDDNLSTMLAPQAGVDVCLFSTFSHVAGKARININRMLQRGGFLEMEPAEELAAEPASSRIKAVALAVSSIKNTMDVKSAKQLIRASGSSAVSPMAGCIFINDTERFSDGSVPESDFDAVKSNLVKFLLARLPERSGGSATVVANPTAAKNRSAAPELLVCAEGVEFYNFEDANLQDSDAPRAVHAPHGFAFLPKSYNCESKEITPIELSQLLRL